MKDVKVIGLDLDGTLVKLKLDFGLLRKELGIPEGDTLGYISSLPRQEARRLMSLLEKREMNAAENAEPAPGAVELLEYCRKKGIIIVVITRNSDEAARMTLDRLGMKVDMVVSRDDAAPKPSPEALNYVLSHFGFEPHEMAYVGDYLYDIQAGNAAGVKTILVAAQERSDEWSSYANYVVEDLHEVVDLLKEGKEIGR